MEFAENLHLSPVSAVVQLHPQLHHIDALDEIPAKGRVKARKEGEEGQTEARAIDVKIKAAEDAEAAMVAGNLELLKKMQDEKWTMYEWVDAEVRPSTVAYRETPVVLTCFQTDRGSMADIRELHDPAGSGECSAA